MDEPLMMETGRQKYYYACNAFFSVAALTNTVNNMIERIKYKMYGNMTILNSCGTVKTTGLVGNPYSFTKQGLDIDDGTSNTKPRDIGKECKLKDPLASAASEDIPLGWFYKPLPNRVHTVGIDMGTGSPPSGCIPR